MSFHVTYKFVQGYDAGQKKIVASEVDQNFSDIETYINNSVDQNISEIETYINNSSVNIAETQTITGDKTFTGGFDITGATVVGGPYINAADAAHAAAPSGSVISLSVPASSGTVTAPADGYITIRAISSASNGSVRLQKLSGFYAQACFAPSAGGLAASLMVSNGDSITVLYQYCTDVALYFCYANGSAPTV